MSEREYQDRLSLLENKIRAMDEFAKKFSEKQSEAEFVCKLNKERNTLMQNLSALAASSYSYVSRIRDGLKRGYDLKRYAKEFEKLYSFKSFDPKNGVECVDAWLALLLGFVDDAKKYCETAEHDLGVASLSAREKSLESELYETKSNIFAKEYKTLKSQHERGEDNE